MTQVLGVAPQDVSLDAAGTLVGASDETVAAVQKLQEDVGATLVTHELKLTYVGAWVRRRVGVCSSTHYVLRFQLRPLLARSSPDTAASQGCDGAHQL